VSIRKSLHREPQKKNEQLSISEKWRGRVEIGSAQGLGFDLGVGAGAVPIDRAAPTVEELSSLGS
jgi:hypothetical protein